MAERETGEASSQASPRLLVFLRSALASLAWPSWGTARSSLSLIQSTPPPLGSIQRFRVSVKQAPSPVKTVHCWSCKLRSKKQNQQAMCGSSQCEWSILESLIPILTILLATSHRVKGRFRKWTRYDSCDYSFELRTQILYFHKVTSYYRKLTLQEINAI